MGGLSPDLVGPAAPRVSRNELAGTGIKLAELSRVTCRTNVSARPSSFV